MGAVPIFAVVLSRKEIDAVLKHLEHPYDLAVKLLYGCGLRLFECVKLRVKNFNFDFPIRKKLHACMISKEDHEKEHGVYNRKKRRIGNKTRSLFYRLIRNISAFGFRAWRPYRSLNSKKQVM